MQLRILTGAFVFLSFDSRIIKLVTIAQQAGLILRNKPLRHAFSRLGPILVYIVIFNDLILQNEYKRFVCKGKLIRKVISVVVGHNLVKSVYMLSTL